MNSPPEAPFEKADIYARRISSKVSTATNATDKGKVIHPLKIFF